MNAEETEGGDPVCWLGELCPDCGAFPERGARACWRCGRSLAAATAEPEEVRDACG